MRGSPAGLTARTAGYYTGMYVGVGTIILILILVLLLT